MDDLVSEFLTETNESLDVVDNELVKFEQDPNNAQILDNIFRLVHTIKGTCGFLGLPRLEALAHAAETVMGRFRDGVPVTGDAVSLILESIDRLKEILNGLAEAGAEPQGSDADLIGRLEAAAEETEDAAPTDDVPAEAETVAIDDIDVLERAEPRLGEVSLEELERAFQETPGPEDLVPTAAEPAPVSAAAEPSDPAKGEAVVVAQSIRVNVDTLESLITTVSELVLTRNQLLEIVRRHEDFEFKVPLQRLSNVTAELQEGVMKTRMQPIGNAWQKLPRIVRDLARDLDKDIELEMVGADTELDRQVLELIKDPLTHMVRNSADHGLETRSARKAVGKSATGTVRLSAYHEGGHIIVEVADDGKGLDAGRIKAKVIERGLATEADVEKMSEAQIHRFIFNAGFSTADKVTSVSGRGVGMDVVRTNIEVIGGSIDVRSVAGEGTVFTIKIPLTLAIVSALIIESGGQRFAIPQIAVMELVRTQAGSDTRIEHIQDTPVLRLRNQLLPLVDMSRVLGLEEAKRAADEARSEREDEAGFIVILQVGSQLFGVVVDGVFHTEEIVVKPMSSLLREISVFSGNTILGDGSVIMIIDPNGLAQAVRTDVAADAADRSRAAQNEGEAKDEAVSLLLFRAGSAEPKAVPLSLITRLEEIEVERIERSNGRELVQYRGRLMPLVYVNDQVTRRTEGSQPMIVFTDSGRSMGLVIDEIVDIVEERLDIEIISEKPGVLGSTVVRGKATEVDRRRPLPAARFRRLVPPQGGRRRR